MFILLTYNHNETLQQKQVYADFLMRVLLYLYKPINWIMEIIIKIIVVAALYSLGVVFSFKTSG